MNRNYALDLAKCLAVMAVVLIHATADLYYKGASTPWNYDWYRPALNFAVPVFFAASGYLLYKKTEGPGNNDYLWQYARKILTFYVGATLFYMLFSLALAFSNRLFLESPWRTALKEIVWKWNYANLLNGSLGWFHLYFLATLFAACVLLVLLRGFKLDAKSVLLVSAIGYLLTLVGYVRIDQLYPLGGPLKGFFFLSIGYFVSSIEVQRIRRPGLALLASVGLYYLCSFWQVPLAEVPLAFVTYYIAVLVAKYPNFGRGSALASWGTMTLVIYIFHDAARVLVERAFIYGGVGNYYELPVFYLIAIPFSFFAPLAVSKLSRPLAGRLRRVRELSDTPQSVPPANAIN